MHNFQSGGNSINVCPISHVCEIFEKLIKCKKFDLENEGQDQGA